MQHEIEKMYFSTSNIFKDVNISCVQLHRRVSSSSTLAFISAALNARVKRAIAATSHTLLLWCVIFTCRSMYCTFCVCINIVRPQGNDVLMTFEFPPFSFFFFFYLWWKGENRKLWTALGRRAPGLCAHVFLLVISSIFAVGFSVFTIRHV